LDLSRDILAAGKQRSVMAVSGIAISLQERCHLLLPVELAERGIERV